MLSLSPIDAQLDVVIRPNRSLSSAGAVALAGLFLATLSAISGYFALQGAWLVLPFAGLELLLLGGGLWTAQRASGSCERISRDGDELVVSQRHGSRVEEQRFPFGWVRIEWTAAANRHWPRRLLVGCCGRRIEIGKALGTADKLELGRRLLHRLDGVWSPAAAPDGRSEAAAAAPGRCYRRSGAARP